ncbi:unnamed protein product [[Candida] boidinii]|nr:unnamed protein product [[Candida] boidinii]
MDKPQEFSSKVDGMDGTDDDEEEEDDDDDDDDDESFEEEYDYIDDYDDVDLENGNDDSNELAIVDGENEVDTKFEDNQNDILEVDCVVSKSPVVTELEKVDFLQHEGKEISKKVTTRETLQNLSFDDDSDGFLLSPSKSFGSLRPTSPLKFSKLVDSTDRDEDIDPESIGEGITGRDLSKQLSEVFSNPLLDDTSTDADVENIEKDDNK